MKLEVKERNLFKHSRQSRDKNKQSSEVSGQMLQITSRRVEMRFTSIQI